MVRPKPSPIEVVTNAIAQLEADHRVRIPAEERRHHRPTGLIVARAVKVNVDVLVPGDDRHEGFPRGPEVLPPAVSVNPEDHEVVRVVAECLFGRGLAGDDRPVTGHDRAADRRRPERVRVDAVVDKLAARHLTLAVAAHRHRLRVATEDPERLRQVVTVDREVRDHRAVSPERLLWVELVREQQPAEHVRVVEHEHDVRFDLLQDLDDPLLAVGVSRVLGVGAPQVHRGVVRISPVSGRQHVDLVPVQSGQPVTHIVDNHTETCGYAGVADHQHSAHCRRTSIVFGGLVVWIEPSDHEICH
jgi:hypothetical protein